MKVAAPPPPYGQILGAPLSLLSLPLSHLPVFSHTRSRRHHLRSSPRRDVTLRRARQLGCVAVDAPPSRPTSRSIVAVDATVRGESAEEGERVGGGAGVAIEFPERMMTGCFGVAHGSPLSAAMYLQCMYILNFEI